MLRAVVFALLIAYAAAHAGLSAPTPRGTPCTATSDLADCGLTTSPCGGVAAGTPTEIMAGKYDVKVHQRVSHFNTNNTYTINWVDSEGATTQLVSRAQTAQESGNDISITFNVDIPAGAGTGYIQMIFDAEPGLGSVYYSCADVKVMGESAGAAQIAVSLVLLLAALLLLA